jgi:hypothetical protein
MPSKRTPSNPRTPEKAEPIPERSIDIDDAAIDESAVVYPDEELDELANPDDGGSPNDDGSPNDPASPRKSAWRERDANRRAHGEDDLKA